MIIGGVPATVTFAGLTPGSQGLYQINVEIPHAVSSGDAVPVMIQSGGRTANTVTIAVE